MVISYLLRQLQSRGDVFSLSALVATTQQDDQETPSLYVIDPISGAIMDTKLADALANRLYVARIAECEAAQPSGDLSLGPSVPQTGKHSEKILVSRTSNIRKL
jgi:hypothetical protein